MRKEEQIECKKEEMNKWKTENRTEQNKTQHNTKFYFKKQMTNSFPPNHVMQSRKKSARMFKKLTVI